MASLIIVVVTVILTSAICSLFEAVLYSVPLSHIEQLVNSNRSSGRILKKLRDKVDAPITAILSLNTIANTAGAAVAGAIALEVLGSQWLVYFSVAFTLGILLFSEVLPKTAGVVYSRPLSSFIARPLHFLVWIFGPLVWLIGMLTRIISRKKSGHQISEEEIIIMAHLGSRTGVIHEDEAMVIQNILSLETKPVKEVMTPRSVMFALDGSLTVAEAKDGHEIFNYTRIPVYIKDFEDIVGIVHRHDIVTALAEDQFSLKLEKIMKPVHFVLESSKLNKVLKKFLDDRQQIYVVLGDLGGLSGVITLEDVLEEILGKEIVDEFDEVTDLRELARKRREKILNEPAK